MKTTKILCLLVTLSLMISCKEEGRPGNGFQIDKSSALLAAQAPETTYEEGPSSINAIFSESNKKEFPVISVECTGGEEKHLPFLGSCEDLATITVVLDQDTHENDGIHSNVVHQFRTDKKVLGIEDNEFELQIGSIIEEDSAGAEGNESIGIYEYESRQVFEEGFDLYTSGLNLKEKSLRIDNLQDGTFELVMKVIDMSENEFKKTIIFGTKK